MMIRDMLLDMSLSPPVISWKGSNKQSMLTSLAKDVIVILGRIFSNEEIGEPTYYKLQEHFDGITYWNDESGQYRVKGGRYLLELDLPTKVTVDLREILREKNFYIKPVVDIDYTGLVDNDILKNYKDNPEDIIATLVAEVISELTNKHKAECLDLKARYELKHFLAGLIEGLPDVRSHRYSNLERSIVLKTPDKRTFLLGSFIPMATYVSFRSPKVHLSYELKELLPVELKQD